MGVRQCGAGRRRMTCGESETGRSYRYSVEWERATWMAMCVVSGNRRRDRRSLPRLLADRRRHPCREEGLADADAHPVHLRLQLIEVLVEAGGDEIIDLDVRQLGADLAKQLLGGIAKHPRGRSGDGVHGLAGHHQAALNGPWELVVHEEELHDPIRGNATVAFAVHLA